MSDHHTPLDPPGEDEVWEMRVEELARRLTYPPTPNVAGQVRARLDQPRAGILPLVVRAAAVAGIALLLATLLIPDLRSRALEFLQIGAVRFVDQPTETPSLPTEYVLPDRSRAPTPWRLRSVLSLPGETTLEAAREAVAFPIRLPAYPPDLGPPDRVFLIEGTSEAVVLVWMDPDQPDTVRFSLHTLGPGNYGQKMTMQTESTTVGDVPAVWATEPHEYLLAAPSGDPLRFRVTSPVLLWVEGDITYRLEGDLSLDEARRIAESLE